MKNKKRIKEILRAVLISVAMILFFSVVSMAIHGHGFLFGLVWSSLMFVVGSALLGIGLFVLWVFSD